MKIIYNSRIINIDDLKFNDLYRLVFYGDGLFESIYCDSNNIYLFQEHLNRLFDGAETLRINSNIIPGFEDLIKEIQALCQFYTHLTFKRIKILVWRSGPGKYLPEQIDDANYLILIEEANRFRVLESPLYYISRRSRLAEKSYSGFKSANALDYVLMALEKSDLNEPVIISKDASNKIAESVSQNVLFIKGKIVYIPSSKSRVQGIMENALIDLFKFNNYEIKYVEIEEKDIESYDMIVLCNSFIIHYIKNNPDFEISWLNESLTKYLSKLPLQP